MVSCTSGMMISRSVPASAPASAAEAATAGEHIESESGSVMPGEAGRGGGGL